jgi:protein tyrosine phosphatase (PTP) superfamily phosphohydrolase (DUF442 family)
LFVAWDQANYNFGTVQPGRIYRSAQMPPRALAETIGRHGIKTVLNLRGSNPSGSWYQHEVATTNGTGATQVDVAMSSCLWMSRAQLRALIQTMDSAEYPLLVHCWWGAERTGLVSAFAELLRPGAHLADARAQLSIRHLFVPVKDGKVMAEHLDQYENWLRANHLEHDPAVFRRWVNEGFVPGIPSREQWPYDPYPLVVITRPGAPPQAVRVAAGAGGAALVR